MSVATPPSLPTHTGSRSSPATAQPRLNRVQQVIAQPPSFARPLLMLLLLLALAVAAVSGALSLSSGVEMRLHLQRDFNAGTHTLPTSLVAQSFYVTRPNLSRVDIQMSMVPNLDVDGRVRLLDGEGLGGQVVYEAPLRNTRFTQGIFQTVEFPPQANSQGRTYTLVVETPDRPLGQSVGIAYNTFDMLSQGAMYTDESAGEPLPGDVSLITYYRYDLFTLLDDTTRVLSEARRLVLSPLLLLLLPGLALLLWLPNSLSAGQRLIAAPGLTALALPVFFLVTRALGIRMGEVQMWALMVLSALAIAGAWWRFRPKVSLKGLKLEDVAFWSLLLGLLAATLVGRFVALRDQVGGIGLDAYHHTVISQLFVEQGGIPSNYEPYAPLASFTYHFGFHSLAASIAWLSGRTSSEEMMLLMPQAGQIADTLPVLTLLLFGWKVLGDRWAGLAAGGLVGLFSIIPAFYVNWSRFTQGFGLALLPVAWVLLIEVLDRPITKRPNVAPSTSAATSPDGASGVPAQQGNQTGRDETWQAALRQSGPYMLAVLGASGLALVHYRVAVIYAVFVALYILWRLVRLIRQKASVPEVLAPIRRVATVAVLSAATLLPWIINLQNFTVKQVSRENEPGREAYYNISERLGPDILYHASLFLLCALALGGIGWAVTRRDLLPLLPAFTWGLVLLYSNPYLFPFRLPGAGAIDLVTVLSGVFIPLCLLAGYPLARFATWVISLGNGAQVARQRLWRVAAGGLLGAAVLVCGLASAMQMVPITIRDNKPYLTPGDINVLTWMRDNLPRDSYVLAEPFAFEWSNDVLGTDAGLWTAYIARVPSSVPIMTAYNERPAQPDYIYNLTSLVGVSPLLDTKHHTPTDADWDALKQAGVTHIFVGSRSEYFDMQFLFNHPDNVTPLYHRDNSWVFALK